jgi:hypothetical protein
MAYLFGLAPVRSQASNHRSGAATVKHQTRPAPFRFKKGVTCHQPLASCFLLGILFLTVEPIWTKTVNELRVKKQMWVSMPGEARRGEARPGQSIRSDLRVIIRENLRMVNYEEVVVFRRLLVDDLLGGRGLAGISLGFSRHGGLVGWWLM